MPARRGSIACGWRAQSTPFPYRFRRESELWNLKMPPWRLGGGPYGALPRSQRYPQTSSHDRFVPATPGFRWVFSLPLGRDHRYQFQSHTTESPVPARQAVGCNGRETTGTVHLCARFVFRFEMAHAAKTTPDARLGFARDPRD